MYSKQAADAAEELKLHVKEPEDQLILVIGIVRRLMIQAESEQHLDDLVAAHYALISALDTLEYRD